MSNLGLVLFLEHTFPDSVCLVGSNGASWLVRQQDDMTLMEHHQTKVQTLEVICVAKCSLCEWVLVYKGSKIDLQKFIQKHNSKNAMTNISWAGWGV